MLWETLCDGRSEERRVGKECGDVWTARLYFTNWAYAAEMSSEPHMLPPTLWI